MASKVEIANRALQKLGAKRIVTLDEDSVNARIMNAAFEPVKLAELERHVWSFAIERAELAADATSPTWGRANAFELPPDFVRLAHPYPELNRNTDDWQIEGRKILTNDSAPLRLPYVKNVTDPNVMTPLFREALATRLAIECCEAITQSNTKKEILKDDYREIIAEAKKSNAIQRVSAEPPEDTWVTVRR